MKFKQKLFQLARTSLVATVLAGAQFIPLQPVKAESTETFYYWVALSKLLAGNPRQSFVVAVDSVKAAEIEAIFSNGGRPGLSGLIAAGSVAYNKDYYTPDHRVWNWHFTVVDDIFDHNGAGFGPCECPPLKANPSDIAANPEQWIQQNGNRYTPEHYEIQGRIDPSKRDAMVNVSNRGMAGTGEKTLITGFIVTGGEPRNVVVRAMGPSLGASGVQQFAANPKLTLFLGSQIVRGNNAWKSDQRAAELSGNYPALAPGDDREAAMLLTLLPGTYTLHGMNEDGTEGVVLLEVYDVDNAVP